MDLNLAHPFVNVSQKIRKILGRGLVGLRLWYMEFMKKIVFILFLVVIAETTYANKQVVKGTFALKDNSAVASYALLINPTYFQFDIHSMIVWDTNSNFLTCKQYNFVLYVREDGAQGSRFNLRDCNGITISIYPTRIGDEQDFKLRILIRDSEDHVLADNQINIFHARIK